MVVSVNEVSLSSVVTQSKTCHAATMMHIVDFVCSAPELFALLLMGHFLGDFGLQNDRMAVEKCPGHDVTLAWQWWLTAHAAIHGFLVALITGLPLIGLAEWLAHALIDIGKCRFKYSLLCDQLLHVFTKILWIYFTLFFGEFW